MYDHVNHIGMPGSGPETDNNKAVMMTGTSIADAERTIMDEPCVRHMAIAGH